MIKMRIKKDDKANDGKVFHIELAQTTEAIAEAFGKDIANSCCTYGLRVYLQKDVAEGGEKGSGRDYKRVEAELDRLSIPHTITEWVKGEKTVDPRLELVKGLSIDELADLVAKAKANR